VQLSKVVERLELLTEGAAQLGHRIPYDDAAVIRAARCALVRARTLSQVAHPIDPKGVTAASKRVRAASECL